MGRASPLLHAAVSGIMLRRHRFQSVTLSCTDPVCGHAIQLLISYVFSNAKPTLHSIFWDHNP